jgi:acyl carrier protein
MNTAVPFDDEAALQTVRGLVAGLLQMADGDIDPQAQLTDLGLNSVELIDLVVRLENDHGVQFDPGRDDRPELPLAGRHVA